MKSRNRTEEEERLNRKKGNADTCRGVRSETPEKAEKRENNWVPHG